MAADAGSISRQISRFCTLPASSALAIAPVPTSIANRMPFARDGAVSYVSPDVTTLEAQQGYTGSTSKGCTHLPEGEEDDRLDQDELK